MDESKRDKKQRKRKKNGESEATFAKEAEEAAALESFLFGANGESLLGGDSGSEVEDNVTSDRKERGGRRSSVVDANIVSIAGESVADSDEDEGGLSGEEQVGRKAAWVDEEEEARGAVNVSRVNRLRKLRKEEGEELISAKDYISRLREQHRALNGGVSWAELPSENSNRRTLQADSETDEDDVNAEAGFTENDGSIGVQTLLENKDLVVKGKSRLPQGLIELTPMRDGNGAESSNAVVRSVEFHKNAQILMTAGFDKKLRFFQIDGKNNPKVQSVFLEGFPVHKAAFVSDGSRVVASGRRSYYFMYDLEAGRVERMSPLIGRSEKSLEVFAPSPDGKHLAFLGNDGYIMLCSLNSRQWVGNLKMNGSVSAVAFADEGRQLISTGGDGEIYHWDLRTRRCFHKGIDDGCTKSTALDVSRDSRLFATGSGSGVVNVYDRDSYIGGASRPLKSLENLVTGVDTIKFNNDAQIMAITSKVKKNALRLVHLPSYTVFSNWPRLQTPLQLVHCLDFSPGGGYLAVGNAAGRVLLYRLRHYEHA